MCSRNILEYMQEYLLKWYHQNKRSLPWREDPTPYHVWVSEIMLQQTRVEAVIDYYSRFIEKLPTIQHLAEVDDDLLHKLWQGLGYYNRAKNLKKAAQQIVKDYGGNLPSSYEELLVLPGIGPYTAGAIASIAFHQRVPAIDGNVLRVIARVFGDYGDIGKTSTRARMKEIVESLLPVKDVQSFNQALMELGALVCIPKGFPHCQHCPVHEICDAYQRQTQLELPVKAAKKSRKIEQRTVFIFVNAKEEFFIRKRQNTGLLAGLWEFISLEGHLAEEQWKEKFRQEKLAVRQMAKIESAKHIFSHIEWQMEGYFVKIDPSPTRIFDQVGLWCDFAQIKAVYSIPSAFRGYLLSIEKGMIRQQIERKKDRLSL